MMETRIDNMQIKGFRRVEKMPRIDPKHQFGTHIRDLDNYHY